MRHYDLQMKSIELTAANVKSYDCVIIATHHSAYDWQWIADNAGLLVDTRDALRQVKGRRDHIVQA
jgi:UDP-N-acetyl-D-glucosamine dehydrogenase